MRLFPSEEIEALKWMMGKMSCSISPRRSSSEGSGYGSGSGSESGSCWGFMRLMRLPWKSRRTHTRLRDESVCCCEITDVVVGSHRQTRRPDGGFGYDPLSYAQNFDEGSWDDNNDDRSSRGFSSRYAAPTTSSKTLLDNRH